MDCSDEVLYQRLLERSKDSQRDDDKPDIIQQRLRSHHDIQAQLIEVLPKQWLRRVSSGTAHHLILADDIRIKSEGSVQEVQERFEHALQDAVQKLRMT